MVLVNNKPEPEPTLLLRYVRGAGGGRPCIVSQWERVKIRAAMAGLAANGGVIPGRIANFNDPQSRQELVRFFRFMKQHDDIYHASTAAGECVLLYPRSQVHEGRFTEAMSAFNAVGFKLLDDHVLFDVLPDDIATPDNLARYRRVFTISSLGEMRPEYYDSLSRFEAPSTVRVSASRPEKGNIWDIHFVNYNRKEPPENERTGLAADENPIPVSGVKADLVSPAGLSVRKIEWMTPESPESRELRIENAGNRVHFTAPGFLVYAVARVHPDNRSPNK
jgi:hypothetical protein